MASSEPGAGQLYAAQARKYGEQGRISPSKSGGAQRTKGSRGIGRPTSGLSSQRGNWTPGYSTLIGPGRDQCGSPDPSHTSNGRSQRNGSEPGSPLSRIYKPPREQRPNKIVAGSSKRLASRLYQL